MPTTKPNQSANAAATHALGPNGVSLLARRCHRPMNGRSVPMNRMNHGSQG